LCIEYFIISKNKLSVAADF